MNVISFRCASCQQVLRVGADKAGRKAKCTKCGKELTIPKAATAPAQKAAAAPAGAPTTPAAATTAAATPPPAEPPAKKFSDDEEDDGGAYNFIEAPKPVEDEKSKRKRKGGDQDEEDEEQDQKKQEKPRPITRRKIKKKTVQFGDEWLKFRVSLLLVFLAACGWLIVWLLHTVVVLLGLLEHASYGAMVDNAIQSGGGQINMPSLVVGLLAGAERADLGRILLIVEQVLELFSSAAFLAGICVCLGVPNTGGTRSQAIAMVVVGALNILVLIMLRLLPLVGAIPYVMVPLLAPEGAINEANIDRVLPIPVFWCGAPFWEVFATILVVALYYAEPIMFCVFLRAAALALKDDEWLEPRAFMLLRVGLGQFFILLAFYLLSITGTSSVLRNVLFVAYALWRGFLLGFIIWLAVICYHGRARVQYLLVEDEDED